MWGDADADATVYLVVHSRGLVVNASAGAGDGVGSRRLEAFSVSRLYVFIARPATDNTNALIMTDGPMYLVNLPIQQDGQASLEIVRGDRSHLQR